VEKHAEGDVMRPKVLIPVGYGLNCEDETAHVYKLLRADAEKVHINDVLEKPKMISDYQIIDFVGGFADGDHVSAGKILANRLRYGLGDELSDFVRDGKLIIGVCNGFQALAKSGLLPGFDADYKTQRITLVQNDSGRYEDRWVDLSVSADSKCVWTRGIDKLCLPVRHGEGKLKVEDRSVLKRLARDGQVVLRYADPQEGKPTMRYPFNPNGSAEAIAGVCDTTGRVLGMMPHREAYWSPYNHPGWQRQKMDGTLPKEGAGISISRNGVEYAKENLL
jgi:phosphoribosylformylglycinamidine synthase